MGSVYLAQDTQLRRQVALKVPKFSADTDPVLLERFYREARAAACLFRAPSALGGLFRRPTSESIDV